MTLGHITFKQVLDEEGYVRGLELHQDGRYITVTFAAEGTHENYSRWESLKGRVDKISEISKKHALETMFGSEYYRDALIEKAKEE